MVYHSELSCTYLFRHNFLSRRPRVGLLTRNMGAGKTLRGRNLVFFCGGRLDRWGYLASGRAGLSISPSRRQGVRKAMDWIGAGVQPRQWALF